MLLQYVVQLCSNLAPTKPAPPALDQRKSKKEIQAVCFSTCVHWRPRSTDTVFRDQTPSIQINWQTAMNIYKLKIFE